MSHSLARLSSVVFGAGIAVRYVYYVLGALFFLQVTIATLYLWSLREKHLDEAPAFRLSASELARLPVKTMIKTGTWAGRIEMRQYGNRHGRETTMSVYMILPPKGPPVEYYLGQDVLYFLGNAQAWLANTAYDLDTRFGPVHATDLNLVADDRRKLCLAFGTRFDTPDVRFTGWYCETDGSKPSPHRLACMLDAMVLDAPLASPEADAFMRERMRRPSLCSATPVTQTTDTRPFVPKRRR